MLSVLLANSLHAGEQLDGSLPYFDVQGGRDGVSFADAPENSERLYNFYGRQAEYYLDGNPVPEILPPFPGLDGGTFGHWGAYHENSVKDPRWNDSILPSVVAASSWRARKGVLVKKGVFVDLGEGDLAIGFDMETLNLFHVWRTEPEDNFLAFDPHRWSITKGATPKGEVLLDLLLDKPGVTNVLPANDVESNSITRYNGYKKHGRRVVFEYVVNGVKIADSPWGIATGGGSSVSRILEFPEGVAKADFRIAQVRGAKPVSKGRLHYITQEARGVVSLFAARSNADKGSASFTADGRLSLSHIGSSDVVNVYYWKGAREDLEAVLHSLETGKLLTLDAFNKEYPPQWQETLRLPGTLGDEDGAYVIDRIPVPFENPYRSMMFLSGVDFFSDGAALICTIMGDVWKVSGLNDTLEAVTWKRFAAGLNQPLGLKIIDDVIYVLCRDQITILEDLNGDDEADYYRNFCNLYETSSGGHDFSVDLQEDAEGNFYFASNSSMVKVSHDGNTATVLADGIRNPDGSGALPDGTSFFAYQEGQWTPASGYGEVRPGDFFGFQRGESDKREIAPPFCFIPRGVDNSSGGMTVVEGNDWGPLEGQLLGFSFGAGSYMLILRSEREGYRSQGAAIPLSGYFASGAHRGSFNPVDGQLYICGTEGWGNYAIQDGSFDRVRYTGGNVNLPESFHAHSNGLLLKFTDALDKESAEDVASYFCQQWNYEYSPAYGSLEYSVREPHSSGHDPVEISAAHLLKDGRSVFLEIPEIVPVMQMHLHLRLKDSKGEYFQRDMFSTLNWIDEAHPNYPIDNSTSKPKVLELRIRRSVSGPILSDEVGQAEPSIERGEQLFTAYCAACHGNEGQGIAGQAPILAQSEWVTGKKDRVPKIILKGLVGPLAKDGERMDFPAPMPPFGAIFNDSEIASIASFIRQAWGNNAKTLSVEDVADARKRTKKTATFITTEELGMSP